MASSIPTLPDEAQIKNLSFLELCTFGLIEMDSDEACINAYAAKSGNECSLKQLGFTHSEAYNFLQYLYPLEKIVEKRRKLFYDASNSDLPF